MKQVLGVIGSGDSHAAERLGQALKARGAHFVAVEADYYPTAVTLNVQLDEQGPRGWLRTRAGERVDLGALHAIWWRRFNVALYLPREGMPGGVRRACIQESEAAFLGLLSALPCRMVDDPHLAIRAEHKAWQLALAAQQGLTLPPTVVSNDEAPLRAWAQGAPPLITKMLAASGLPTANGPGSVPTSAVTPEDLEQLSGLNLAPVTFQHRVGKALEVRVVVIGDRVFAAGVDSQRLPQAQVDWRQGIFELMPLFRTIPLPAELERSLIALNRAMGLRYGSADFILTPEGQWVFLEINPGGEWGWVQEYAGHDIAGALADCLLEDAP